MLSITMYTNSVGLSIYIAVYLPGPLSCKAVLPVLEALLSVYRLPLPWYPLLYSSNGLVVTVQYKGSVAVLVMYAGEVVDLYCFGL